MKRLLPCLLVLLVVPACDAPLRGRRVDGGAIETDAGRPPPTIPDAALPPPSSCESRPGLDVDLDGFANGEDCNDCSPQINPGAYDFPGDGNDEDCDGSDAAVSDCDRGLLLASSSPIDAARALGLCAVTDAASSHWGVISARFVRADGTGAPVSMNQVGLLQALGAQLPRQGSTMLALSSGVAREPGQPAYTHFCDVMRDEPQGYPPGYPAPSPACPGVVGGAPYDSVALEVQVRVPTNARSMSFLSAFFTYEYPDFICDEYNDFFVVLREGPSGWENLVRDTMGNAVSVNNAFLAACTPGFHGGRTFDCPLGTDFLADTGFDGSSDCGYDPESGITGGVGASTGWLRTTTAVSPGEILTLRFAIWDSGDADLDSLALIDGWEWEIEAVEVTETEPVLF